MVHATSLPPLSAGRKLGDKFEIVGVLGEGGTGIVYDARRLAEGDSVALKVIHQHLAGDPQIRGRFAREAAILRRLEGDGVCPVLEFGEIPDPRREGAGLLYMVLARVDGPALDAVLKRERLLPIDRIVRILLEVCDALGEAHAQGVIHRDLKPGNVLLRTDGRAVVVDFGMAKIMTGGGTGTTALTQHNMVFGTPEYMAPEQARGDELDARCDVYAAGIILYELLVGSVPFSGPTPLNVLTAQMTETPSSPSTRAPDRGISRALEAVVLHAIAKDPGERYPTAGALAAAMTAAVAAPDDVEAVRPSTRVHVRIDTTDAHALTLPSPLRLTNPSARAPAVASVRPSVPAASSSPWWIVVCVVAAVAGIALGAWLSMHAGK
ncbi:MAG TPA: serine/threonine-protein kinase [Polyangiaceae bacterium]